MFAHLCEYRSADSAVKNVIILSKGTLFSHALTDEEYKLTMGEGYLFFEVTEPEELQYTFKINPAAFGEPWVT